MRLLCACFRQSDACDLSPFFPNGDRSNVEVFSVDRPNDGNGEISRDRSNVEVVGRMRLLARKEVENDDEDERLAERGKCYSTIG
jgi:hypothetical protein